MSFTVNLYFIDFVAFIARKDKSLTAVMLNNPPHRCSLIYHKDYYFSGNCGRNIKDSDLFRIDLYNEELYVVTDAHPVNYSKSMPCGQFPNAGDQCFDWLINAKVVWENSKLNKEIINSTKHSQVRIPLENCTMKTVHYCEVLDTVSLKKNLFGYDFEDVAGKNNRIDYSKCLTNMTKAVFSIIVDDFRIEYKSFDSSHFFELITLAPIPESHHIDIAILNHSSPSQPSDPMVHFPDYRLFLENGENLPQYKPTRDRQVSIETDGRNERFVGVLMLLEDVLGGNVIVDREACPQILIEED